MTGNPTQQHTLSRFYVARFGDPKPRRNPFVWYYPLDEPPPRTWRREKAKRISVRKDYYTQTGVPDDKKYGLERALKLSEDWAADPIEKICDGRRHPTAEDIHAVALFMMTTTGRAPARVAALEGLRADTLKNAMRLLYDRVRGDPAQHALVLEELKAKGSDTSVLQDPERFNPDRPDVDLNAVLRRAPASAVRALIEVGTDMAPRLTKMGWLVLRTSRDLPFISSDVPLYWGSGGPVFEVTFPLSSTIALYLRDDPRATNGGRQTVFEDREADSRLVDIINHRTAHGAQHFLIACATQFPGHQRILSLKNPPRRSPSAGPV